MNKIDLVTRQTREWVSTVIVKHNVCPFAGQEVKRNSIRYSVFTDSGLQQSLEYLLSECRILDVDNEVSTSLLLFPEIFLSFDDYLDFVDMANALMVDEGYEGIYQLATFHPDYCFADVGKIDPSNYTNRSPYPMLHIIREDALEQALKDYPDPESIPENNIKMARELGLDNMQAMLQACYDIKDNAD